MATFTESVGVAPATTTLMLNASEQRSRGIFQPYAVPSQFNGLGLVLEPRELNRTLPGGSPFLKPFDPFYNTMGNSAFYYDDELGALGATPTDFQLIYQGNYVPVASAWVAFKEAFYTPPYIPPRGWRPVPAPYGPDIQLRGEAEVPGSTALKELKDHFRRIQWLVGISAAAALVTAAAHVVRATREKR